MNILIFNNVDLSKPIEKQDIDIVDNTTINDFLSHEINGYIPTTKPVFDIICDDLPIEPKLWDSYNIKNVKTMRIVINPQGTTAAVYIAIVMAVASAAYSFYMMHKIGKQNTKSNTSSGNSIYDVNAQGNKVKLGEVIAENFGKFKRYPDYLADIHSYYADGNVRVSDYILCQGIGKFEHSNNFSDVYIGNNPLNNFDGNTVINHTDNVAPAIVERQDTTIEFLPKYYSSINRVNDVQCRVLEPNDDLSQNTIDTNLYKCWFNSLEVTESGHTLSTGGTLQTTLWTELSAIFFENDTTNEYQNRLLQNMSYFDCCFGDCSPMCADLQEGSIIEITGCNDYWDISSPIPINIYSDWYASTMRLGYHHTGDGEFWHTWNNCLDNTIKYRGATWDKELQCYHTTGMGYNCGFFDDDNILCNSQLASIESAGIVSTGEDSRNWNSYETNNHRQYWNLLDDQTHDPDSYPYREQYAEQVRKQSQLKFKKMMGVDTTIEYETQTEYELQNVWSFRVQHLNFKYVGENTGIYWNDTTNYNNYQFNAVQYAETTSRVYFQQSRNYGQDKTFDNEHSVYAKADLQLSKELYESCKSNLQNREGYLLHWTNVRIYENLNGTNFKSDNGRYVVTGVYHGIACCDVSTAEMYDTDRPLAQTGSYMSKPLRNHTKKYLVRKLKDDGTIDEDWDGFNGVFQRHKNARIEVVGTSDTINYVGWYRGNPIGVTNHSEYELDFLAPLGIYKMNDEGNNQKHSVDLRVEFKRNGSNKINALTIKLGTENGCLNTYKNLNDELGYTLRIKLDAGDWLFRVGRITAEHKDDNKYCDTVKWNGLKSVIVDSPKQYANMTTLLLRVTGSEALTQLNENQVSTLYTRMLPQLNSNTLVATTDIAPVIKYIANNSKYSNILDLSNLQEFDTFWKSQNFTCNGSMDDDGVLLDRLRDVANCGFSSPISDGTTLKMSRISLQSNTSFNKIITPLDTVNGVTITYTTPKDDDVKEVVCEYIDPVNFKTNTVYISHDENMAMIENAYPTQSSSETVDLWGVTDRETAINLAYHRLQDLTYSRITYKFDMLLEGLTVKFNDYVGLLLDYNFSNVYGEILDYNATDNYLLVDKSLTCSNCIVWLKDIEGKSHIAHVDHCVGDKMYLIEDELPIDYSKFGSDTERPHYAIGVIVPCWVTEVSPSSDTVSITMTNYDSRVFDAELGWGYGIGEFGIMPFGAY